MRLDTFQRVVMKSVKKFRPKIRGDVRGNASLDRKAIQRTDDEGATLSNALTEKDGNGRGRNTYRQASKSWIPVVEGVWRHFCPAVAHVGNLTLSLVKRHA